MKAFRGFDREEKVTVPAQFFTELLPFIEDRAELMVTLYALYLADTFGEEHPFFRAEDLAQDRTFYQGLADPQRTSEEALQEGLERAVARGTLLHVRSRQGPDTQVEDWYCLNTPANRERLDALARGELVGTWALPPEHPTAWEPVRPNIFTLYEQNIGLLQPLIADELRQAEQEYPAEWIEEAFRIAAERNVRHWKYIRAILERWAREGRGHEKTGGRDSQDPKRYISGPYAHLIKH
ncbi:MAG: DnaD domain protein [Chloroflexi bacterium]|nr:DnaD domain protein [Chloroflexota bacterium]